MVLAVHWVLVKSDIADSKRVLGTRPCTKKKKLKQTVFSFIQYDLLIVFPLKEHICCPISDTELSC